MEKNKRKKLYKTILYILLAFMAVGLYAYLYRKYGVFKTPEEVRSFVLKYGPYGSLVYILLQTIQIVVFFLPGEIFQIAGGYIFGTFLGGVLSLLGILIGSTIAYWLAHIFGRAFVHKILSKKDLWMLEKLEALGSKAEDRKRLNAVVLFLYLIPGVPKDILAYICGISEITFKNFILYSVVGRMPALFISLYFGEKFSLDNLTLLIIIAVIMSILFVVGIIYGRKIIHALSKEEKK